MRLTRSFTSSTFGASSPGAGGSWGKYCSSFRDEVGLNVEPTTRLGELSIAEQQQVEIAKALSLDAKILIFDEPCG